MIDALVDLQDAIVYRWHRLQRRLRPLWRCGFRHTDGLVFTPHRVYLHCAVCGRDTRGWDCGVRQIGRMVEDVND